MITSNVTAAELRGAAWRKSSYSGGSQGQCIEVADLADRQGIRDSKHPEGPVLAVPTSAFAHFTAAVKAGAYDA